ncbi:hypothetical protein AB0B54_21395 [Microbispora bryophytorum]|uniref:hypothetical protein n=1 Tax=Microbispora bryophytorum TaxID=1460882 RepID=UPI0033CC3039
MADACCALLSWAPLIACHEGWLEEHVTAHVRQGEAFAAAKPPLHRHLAVDTVSGRVARWTAESAVSSRCVHAGVAACPA